MDYQAGNQILFNRVGETIDHIDILLGRLTQCRTDKTLWEHATNLSNLLSDIPQALSDSLDMDMASRAEAHAAFRDHKTGKIDKLCDAHIGANQSLAVIMRQVSEVFSDVKGAVPRDAQAELLPLSRQLKSLGELLDDHGQLLYTGDKPDSYMPTKVGKHYRGAIRKELEDLSPAEQDEWLKRELRPGWHSPSDEGYFNDIRLGKRWEQGR